MRVFLGDQSVEITKCSSCIGEGELASSCCFEFLWELGLEARPRQTSVLACVVLAGIS